MNNLLWKFLIASRAVDVQYISYLLWCHRCRESESSVEVLQDPSLKCSQQVQLWLWHGSCPVFESSQLCEAHVVNAPTTPIARFERARGRIETPGTAKSIIPPTEELMPSVNKHNHGLSDLYPRQIYHSFPGVMHCEHDLFMAPCITFTWFDS